MIIVGIILLVVGFLLEVSILWTMGVIVLVLGAAFWVMGAIGRPVVGRRYWF